MMKLLILLTFIGAGSCGGKFNWKFSWKSFFDHDEDYYWDRRFSSGTWPPSFCNEMDCPEYTVNYTTHDYELRSYSGDITWVSTKASGTERYARHLKKRMALKLIRYLYGHNADGMRIPMAVPAVTKVIPGNCDGRRCESNYTMSFYLADPIFTPEPTDTSLFLADMPATDFYVRSFSGYAKFDEYMEEADYLVQALERDGKRYKAGVYYFAEYDAPYKFWDRHNEVWLRALDAEDKVGQ